MPAFLAKVFIDGNPVKLKTPAEFTYLLPAGVRNFRSLSVHVVDQILLPAKIRNQCSQVTVEQIAAKMNITILKN